MKPRILTIAGSDSGGGAGIQADLKTFTVLDAYGLSVIAALTAQNTLGVQGVAQVDPAFVGMQLESVLSDIGVDAAKTGMLNTAEVVGVVADAIEKYAVEKLVVDPVMVAKSGDRLLREEAIQAVKTRLIPLAAILTPNSEEAAVLVGFPIENRDDMQRAAEALLKMGARAVIIKGGHTGSNNSDDLWFDGSRAEWLKSPRFNNQHTHGTGCTLSAALATWLGKGAIPFEAARQAKRFISGAIRTASPLGGGIGPVNHLWEWDEKNGEAD